MFKDVSEVFEKHQDTYRLPWNKNSSFSPEDLVSNLLYFHREINGVSLADIRELCGVIEDVDINLELYDRFPWNQQIMDWSALRFDECAPCTEILPFPDRLRQPLCDRNTVFENKERIPVDERFPDGTTMNGGTWRTPVGPRYKW
jgi:hypothetical protein